jgi:large conductance mechanosensitive channel
VIWHRLTPNGNLVRRELPYRKDLKVSGTTTEEKKPGPLTGFKEFLMRGNVVELAVAVVIGAAFTKIVDAVVKGVINPVIGAMGSKDLEGYRSCLVGPCSVNDKGEIEGVFILWGSVISATLTFVLTAAVVYFLMIVPMNRFNEARKRKQAPVDELPTTVEVTELQLLTEIRDLLARRDGTPTAPGAR